MSNTMTLVIPDDSDVVRRFDDWTSAEGLDRDRATVAAMELFMAAPSGLRRNALNGEADCAASLMSIVSD